MVYNEVNREGTEMTQQFSLKSARAFRNITQQEMADRLGVHCNTYAYWEKHPETIRIKDAEKISMVLDMPVSAIFYGINTTKCG